MKILNYLIIILKASEQVQYRLRPAKFPMMEDCLFMKMNDLLDHDVIVTDKILISKAKDISNYFTEIKESGFNFSQGWLQGFKLRYGIKQRIKHGESASVSQEVVENGRKKMQEITSHYALSDIYNMDETGLFYRLKPGKTLADKPVSGTKNSKDRLTVGLCMNADGTDKLKPIIINKSKRPRSFGKIFNPQTICFYYHNNKAWMNMMVFKDWVIHLNNKMVRLKRKIVLLLDNAGGHNISKSLESTLLNIKIAYFSPNCTSHLQPADAGIIKSFKSHYASQLVNFYVEQIDDDKIDLIMPDVKQCMYMIKYAWGRVSEETIKNCWLKTKILNTSIDIEISNIMSIDISNNVTELDYKLKLLSLSKFKYNCDSETFLNNIDSVETSEELCLDDIYNIVTNNDETIEDTCALSEWDSNEVENVINLSEAKKAYSDLFSYFEAKKLLADQRIMDLTNYELCI